MQKHKEQRAHIVKLNGSNRVQFCQTQLHIIDQWRKVLISIQKGELSGSLLRNCKVQELNYEPQSKSLFDTRSGAVPFISFSGVWLKDIGFNCGQSIQVVTLPQLIIIVPGI
jgi:hypothetical protein